ncbi:MAG: hypothetical protein K6D38_03940 [Pseudobutyrivibrio sp.]|nr:hypothetical protein [Pseudobutyrivibrio sp.]
MEVHVEDLLNCYSQTNNIDKVKEKIDELLMSLSKDDLNKLLLECRNKFSDTYKDLISALNTELTELTEYVNKYNTEHFKFDFENNGKIDKISVADYLARLNADKSTFDNYIKENLGQKGIGPRKTRIKKLVEYIHNSDNVTNETMEKIKFSEQLRASHNLGKKFFMQFSKNAKKITANIITLWKSRNGSGLQVYDIERDKFININKNSLNSAKPAQVQNVSNINDSSKHRDYRNCYINRQHKFSGPTPVKLADTSFIYPRALETEYESVNPAVDESIYQLDPKRIDSAAYSEEHSETLKRNNEGKKMASRDKSYPASTSITANGNSMKQRNSTHSLN